MVPVIGAFLKAAPRDGETPAFSTISGPQRCPFTFARASSEINFSAAPLDNITCAKVFYQQGREYSRGLLLKYQNGAQRALGHCRVGVDPYQRYDAPRTLCTSTMPVGGPNVLRGARRVII